MLPVLLFYLCVENVDKQGNKSKAMLCLKFEVDAWTNMSEQD